MQTRESAAFARSPLEALLARGDQEALQWLADRLVCRDGVDPAEAPAPAARPVDAVDREGRDDAAEG
jgi:hypothetical protein